MSAREHAVVVALSIAPDELLALYRGHAREVVATASDGRVVRFPATALRPFVGADGVRGRFAVRFDAAHRLRGMERLE